MRTLYANKTSVGGGGALAFFSVEFLHILFKLNPLSCAEVWNFIRFSLIIWLTLQCAQLRMPRRIRNILVALWFAAHDVFCCFYVFFLHFIINLVLQLINSFDSVWLPTCCASSRLFWVLQRRTSSRPTQNRMNVSNS